jgi:hypothetical protein
MSLVSNRAGSQEFSSYMDTVLTDNAGNIRSSRHQNFRKNPFPSQGIAEINFQNIRGSSSIPASINSSREGSRCELPIVETIRKLTNKKI